MSYFNDSQGLTYRFRNSNLEFRIRQVTKWDNFNQSKRDRYTSFRNRSTSLFLPMAPFSPLARARQYSP
jgi:hypothetical protein